MQVIDSVLSNEDLSVYESNDLLEYPMKYFSENGQVDWLAYCQTILVLKYYEEDMLYHAYRYSALAIESLKGFEEVYQWDYLQCLNNMAVLNSEYGFHSLSLDQHLEILNHKYIDSMDVDFEMELYENIAMEYAIMGFQSASVTYFRKFENLSRDMLKIRLLALFVAGRFNEAWLLDGYISNKKIPLIEFERRVEFLEFNYLSANCLYEKDRFEDSKTFIDFLKEHLNDDDIVWHIICAELRIKLMIKMGLKEDLEELLLWLSKWEGRGRFKGYKKYLLRLYSSLVHYGVYIDSRELAVEFLNRMMHKYDINNIEMCSTEDAINFLEAWKRNDMHWGNNDSVNALARLLMLNYHRIYNIEEAAEDKVIIGRNYRSRFQSIIDYVMEIKFGSIQERYFLCNVSTNTDLYIRNTLFDLINNSKPEIVDEYIRLYSKIQINRGEFSNLDKEIGISLQDTIVSYREELDSLLSTVDENFQFKELSYVDYLERFRPWNKYFYIYSGLKKMYLFSVVNENQRFNNLGLNESFDYNAFVDLVCEVYNSTLGAKNSSETTVICSNTQLRSVSFESIILDSTTSPPTYLFQKTPIAYSLGLHLARDFSEYETDEPKLVSFAPYFDKKTAKSTRDCSDEVYSYLKCNQEEAENVAKIMGGTSYTGKMATKKRLMESISEYDIIHLATHACVDTVNYYNSSIILDDGPLLMSDLYETDWNGKTVVLSACNTAQGKVVSGEGVFNFARTLTELGAKEVIVSLWPIDDCSTKDLVEKFYTYLKEGYNSPKALQLARIEYLEEADKLHSQPKFWAPLILISNDINVGKVKKTNAMYWWIGGGLLALLGAGLFYRIKILNKTPLHNLAA